MAANKIDVFTRKAGADGKIWHWSSDGTNSYDIEEVACDSDVSLVVSTCSSENELFFSAKNEEAYKDFIDDISKDIYEILNEVF